MRITYTYSFPSRSLTFRWKSPVPQRTSPEKYQIQSHQATAKFQMLGTTWELLPMLFGQLYFGVVSSNTSTSVVKRRILIQSGIHNRGLLTCEENLIPSKNQFLDFSSTTQKIWPIRRQSMSPTSSSICIS